MVAASCFWDEHVEASNFSHFCCARKCMLKLIYIHVGYAIDIGVPVYSHGRAKGIRVKRSFDEKRSGLIPEIPQDPQLRMYGSIQHGRSVERSVQSGYGGIHLVICQVFDCI